jgi:hypothetical protein
MWHRLTLWDLVQNQLEQSFTETTLGTYSEQAENLSTYNKSFSTTEILLNTAFTQMSTEIPENSRQKGTPVAVNSPLFHVINLGCT